MQIQRPCFADIVGFPNARKNGFPEKSGIFILDKKNPVSYTHLDVYKRQGVSLDRNFAAILAFILNYAAYFGEIFRGGVQSIPRGQYEAAQVLGLSRSQCFFKIVLPQVVKRVIPPVGNEVVTLVKDTALVYACLLYTSD